MRTDKGSGDDEVSKLRASRFRTHGMDSGVCCASHDVDMLDPGSRPVDSAIGCNEPKCKKEQVSGGRTEGEML